MNDLIRPEIIKKDEKYNVISYPDGTKIIYIPNLDAEGFERALEPVYPYVRESFIRLRNKIMDKGWSVVITNTIRTPEQEIALKKKNPKTAVLVSPHTFGVAVDFYIADKQGRNILRTDEVLKFLEKAIREVGLFWGMWFVNFAKEPWHVQVSHDWKAWYRKNVMKV